jgi:hypothetical protein
MGRGHSHPKGAKMTTAMLVREIDSLLHDSTVERKAKIRRLHELALAYWKVIFPEFGTELFNQLTQETIHQRWEEQRRKNELADCRDLTKVLCVLDSPATGDPLGWVR